MPIAIIGPINPGFGADANLNVTDPSKGTAIPLPPQQGGALHWGDVYVSFFTDYGPSRLRVAIQDSNLEWRVESVTVSSTTGRVSVVINNGDQGISVLRAAGVGSGVTPVGYMIEA
jgi:hypothetical protein